MQTERVLFHYNGHGVPKPTANGEIWVFNKVRGRGGLHHQLSCSWSLAVWTVGQRPGNKLACVDQLVCTDMTVSGYTTV